ncbi:unnamed protein product [Parnassius apollo]|uniref:(apollo) hypothetical protein n=1 Tax=Parnassius apollo TaxID=110799 RepID=A0A8S3WWT7_PARAO|nr:unnamed protein product [Parnassius apollo]
MSGIWKFSSFSEPLVQKLLQTANELENNNKWSQKFKHVNKSYLDYYSEQNTNEDRLNVNEYKTKRLECNLSPKVLTECDIGEDTPDLTNIKIKQNVCDAIEAEPVVQFDYMVEECTKNPTIVANLAEHLTISATEKIFHTTLTKDNVNIKFISVFFNNFFPIFLKREQSWFALDLLHKSNKIYPEVFRPVLIEIIKDTNIPSKIVQEFVQSSSLEFQKDFISLIMHIEFTSKMFLHHLYTLYLVYKDCTKTEIIQNYFQSKLIENAPSCINEKNYGRLLLLFLQSQKVMGLSLNHVMLERVIELHKSPFKRPCLTVLNDIKGNAL